jgi:iron complex transport system ATP-binding protein
MYAAQNITYYRHATALLRNVSLSVMPGQLLGIVGPNGAGKSTLLKVLTQETNPTQGRIHVNGKDISHYTPKDLALLRSVLLQHNHLQFSFSAAQVVALSRSAHRTSQKENQKIIEEVMELTDTRQFAKRNYLTLSGGEKQRVQLARVLAQVWENSVYPRFIFLDEPTSSMDIAQQQFMFQLMKHACTRNIGVFAIVHDLNTAVQYADNLCMIRKGSIVDSGNARDVFTKSNIEKTFCCKVTVYHDPCSQCPFIVPEPAGAALSADPPVYEQTTH